jgi:hypothetical protein
MEIQAKESQMAKTSAIVVHPKSRSQVKSPNPERAGQKSYTPDSGHWHLIRHDSKIERDIVLPPGPSNTIVRTPYPIAPSKNGDYSE